MLKNYLLKNILIIFIVFFISNCKEKKPATKEFAGTNDSTVILDTINNSSPYLLSKGRLFVPLHNNATISPPIGGFIKKMYSQKGDYIKKGTLIVPTILVELSTCRKA